MAAQERDMELVGRYLAGLAAREDAAAGAARVRAALSRPVPLAGSRRSRLALAAGVAAAVVLAVLCGPHRSPARASSLELVREARLAHQQPIERCYAVEARWARHRDLTPMPRQARVWTSGDGFWVESRHSDAEPFFVWGREKNGSLWAVLGPRRGVRVTAEQAPRPLALLADVYSCDIDALLDIVLRDCTLTEDTPPGSARVVRAVPRSERTRRWLSHATLEIDPDAKVLRRLVIARNRLGSPFAEATFILTQTRPAEGERYQLESHLARPAQIYEGNNIATVKLELLARWLGRPAFTAGPKPRPDEKADKARQVAFEDVNGKSHTPLSQAGKKATVFIFLLPDCPISNSYAPEIERICKAYADKKVAAFVVHADPDVTAEQAKKHAKEYGLSCPVLLDPKHVLVKWAGAKIAPEVAVLDADGKVVYRGRIDDWYVDYGKRLDEPKQRYLRDALDAVLAGKPVPNATTKALGCPLPEAKK